MMAASQSVPIMRTFHHAIKYILVTIGMIINNAPRSGCKRTRKDGIPTIPKNGINPSEVLLKRNLFLLQKADTDSMSVSLRNSVGCSEKGIPGISNHPRAPLIFTPKISTNISRVIVMMLITLICFFHQV